MKKVLLSNGKPVISNNKIVLTENAEDCICCNPDCKFLYPKCPETNEHPIIRNIGLEVNFPDDTWEFEFEFESFGERTYDDECNTNACSISYWRNESRYYSKIELSGLSGISGSYIGEMIGGNEEECVDPLYTRIVVPTYIAAGTYTYSIRLLSVVETFNSNCLFPPLQNDFTCSGSIPIFVKVNFGGGLTSSGGLPIFPTNLADSSYTFTPFIQIGGLLTKLPGFFNSPELFSLGNGISDINCVDYPFNYTDFSSPQYYPYEGIINPDVFFKGYTEFFQCIEGNVPPPSADSFFEARGPVRTCHNVIPQNGTPANIIDSLSCGGSRTIPYPLLCLAPPTLNQTWNYNHSSLTNVTASFFYV